MNKDILIFKSSSKLGARHSHENDDFTLSFWKPSIRRIIPPGKNFKYVLYWIFNYILIFKNKNYGAVFVYDHRKIVASLLMVPAHYKWPFMNKDDIQFMYVMTNKDYRGKGLAKKMIEFGVEHCGTNKTYWYVTDSHNNASISVAEKAGFALFSKGKNIGILKRIVLKS